MTGWFLFVVAQERVNGKCFVTTDIEEAVTVAYNHRGECSVVVVCIDTCRAEKRTIHQDADNEEIRNRIKNGIQFSETGFGGDPLR